MSYQVVNAAEGSSSASPVQSLDLNKDYTAMWYFQEQLKLYNRKSFKLAAQSSYLLFIFNSVITREYVFPWLTNCLTLSIYFEDPVASLKSPAKSLPNKPKKSAQNNDEEDSGSTKIGRSGNRFLKTPTSTPDVKGPEMTSQEMKKVESPTKGNFLKFSVMWCNRNIGIVH